MIMTMSLIDLTRSSISRNDDNCRPDDRGAFVSTVTVYDTAIPEINGEYFAAKGDLHNMVSKYIREGLFMNRRFMIYRWNRTRWVLAAVPAENLVPNPQRDIDWFIADVDIHNNNFLGDPSLPPEHGWRATEVAVLHQVNASLPRVSPTGIDFEANLIRVSGFQVLTYRPGMTRFDNCLICMEYYQEGRVFVCLPCSHSLHRACLDALFPNDRNIPSNVKCPHCQELHKVTPSVQFRKANTC